MCGLVAVVERDGLTPSPRLVAAMARRLRHRGPDGHGVHCVDGVGLGHTRLAIIDADGGAQPMADARGRRVVFNGEIYNHVELRAELIGQGYVFHTRCDTEVLLHLYDRDGAEMVDRLNGMFAFVIHDAPARRVLAARDAFGIKPLYLWADGARWLFASEIKALLAHPAVSPAVDLDRLAEYFTLQFVLDGDTLFQGVTALPPGHRLLLDLDRGRVRQEPWWQATYAVDGHFDEAEAIARLTPLIEDSVRLRVRADVPVGTWLSGGLDSSLVTALAKPHLPEGALAFHGFFPGADARYGERAHARAVAAHTGATLVEVPIGPEHFAEDLPRLMAWMDEPAAGPGLYPQYRMAVAARERVKVVLGGQGGDELFCGYSRYLVAYLEQALKGGIGESNDEGEHIVSLRSIVPNLPFLRGYEPMLRHFWRDGLFGPMHARYFRLVDRSEGALELFAPDLRARFRGERRGHLRARFEAVFARPDTESYIIRMRAFDRTASLPALLHVEDRVTMAAGLEARVPLLDRRIAEVVDRLPPALIFGGGELKRLLRIIAGPHLPASVTARRDKMGFPFPLDAWLRGPLRDFVHDTLGSRRCRERGLFAPDALARSLSGHEQFSRKLWGLLCVELWFRAFLDDREPSVSLI